MKAISKIPFSWAAWLLIPVVVAAIGLARVQGCGTSDPERPTGQQFYRDLDPPDLANLTAAEIAPGVTVLCYHYFRARFDPIYLLRVAGSVLLGMPTLGHKEFWTTPIGEFEKHLRYFQAEGIPVLTLDEVAAIKERGLPWPPRAVVLTMDDADRSIYEQAWPLLRKYQVTAHMFVPTSHVGTHWAGLDVCTWEQLGEMADSGVVIIESHTHNLHYKIRTTKGPEPIFWHQTAIPVAQRVRTRMIMGDQLQREGLHLPDPVKQALLGPGGGLVVDILASRLLIAEHVGRPARWLAWPYGFADSRLDSLCALAGFAGSVSLRARTIGPEDSPWHLGRFALTAKSSLDRVAATIPAAPLLVESR